MNVDNAFTSLGPSRADRRAAAAKRQRTSDRSRLGKGRGLTDAEKAEIRRRVRAFESPAALAREFRVSKSTILAAAKDAT